MELTKIEDAIELTRQGIDSGDSERLHNQELMLLGIEPKTSRSVHTSDGLPYFPKLTIRELEVGKSREMLNSIHIVASRLLSSQMSVKIAGCHRVTASVMQQYFRLRMEAGGWMEDIRSAGRDILALGFGVAVIGLEEDFASGLQKTVVRHHPAPYVITDPYADNLERSKYVTLVHHFSPEDAQDLGFSEDDLKQFAFTCVTTSDAGKGKHPRPLVRVFEYLDYSTRILILGNLNSGIFKKMANPFPCLPVVFGVNHTSPALTKPYGRIFSEGAAEQFITELERAWKRQLDSGRRARFIRTNVQLDEQDMEGWLAGELEFIKFDAPPGELPIIDHPAQQVDRNLLEAIQYAKAQYRSASNLSDLERGTMASRRVSATEIDTLQSITNANRTSEVMAITSFVKRLAEKVFEIGKLWDKAPLVVDVMGSEVKLNDPDEINSSLHLVFDESEYRVLVDAESLTANDDRAKSAMEIAKLRELMPFLQGVIPADVYVRRLLELIGEDPSEWNVGQQQMMQPPTPQGGQARPEDLARGQVRGQMNAEQR